MSDMVERMRRMSAEEQKKIFDDAAKELESWGRVMEVMKAEGKLVPEVEEAYLSVKKIHDATESLMKNPFYTRGRPR